MAIYASDINAVVRHRWRAGWVLLVLWALLPLHAAAVGLGDLTVRSAINQPLFIEVALHLGSGEKADDLRIAVAGREVYERLGLQRRELLNQLSFEVARSTSGASVIRGRSREPIREPIIELILAVRWKGGTILREYPILLDLPQAMPAVAEAAPAPARETQPVVASPAPTPAATPAAPVIYGPVQRGETLSQIAQRMKPDGVSTPQMTVALFHANPHAFIGGNMNHLRWGTTLAVPSAEEVRQTKRTTAVREMGEQYARWRGEPAPAPVEPQAPIMAPPGGSALQIVTPRRVLTEDEVSHELSAQLEQLRSTNEQVAVENEALRTRLGELEQQALLLAEQVLALPPPADEAAAEPAAPPVAQRVTRVPQIRAELPLPAPAPWWKEPMWWVAILATLLGLSVLLLGILIWRRYRHWEYRDLSRALQDDEAAAQQALHEALGLGRQRSRG